MPLRQLDVVRMRGLVTWALGLLMKQHIVPYIGEMRTVATGAMFYASMMSLMLMGLTAYQLVIMSWAVVHAPWLTLWRFLGLLVVPGVVAVIIEWKFFLPSIFALSNRQSYRHNSPFAADLKQVLEGQAEIKKLLKGEK